MEWMKTMDGGETPQGMREGGGEGMGIQLEGEVVPDGEGTVGEVEDGRYWKGKWIVELARKKFFGEGRGGVRGEGETNRVLAIKSIYLFSPTCFPPPP